MDDHENEGVARFRGAGCVVCDQDTDTAFAAIGDAGWHVKILTQLGVPADDGPAIITARTGATQGYIPDGRFYMDNRACARCCERAKFDPPLIPIPLASGLSLPTFTQPPDND